MAAALVGCGFGDPGPSGFEQMMHSRDEAKSLIVTRGGSVMEKRYPVGEAYTVDLSGMTIDDELVQSLPALGKIAELDLSGSTITDAQLAELATREKLGYLYKLDLSDTQVSDAGLHEAIDLGILAEVNVKGTKVTPAGIEQFRKQQPKLPYGLKLKVVQ